MTHTSVVDALNVPKMIGIFLSLLFSPLVGMMVAGVMVFALRRY